LYCEQDLKNLDKSKDGVIDYDLNSIYSVEQVPKGKGNIHKNETYDYKDEERVMLKNVDNLQRVPINSYTIWPLVDFVNIDLSNYGKIKCSNVYLVAVISQKISNTPLPGFCNLIQEEKNLCVKKNVEFAALESNDKTNLKVVLNEYSFVKKEKLTMDKDSNDQLVLKKLKITPLNIYHHTLNLFEIRNISLHQYGCQYKRTNILINKISFSTPYSIWNIGVDKSKENNSCNKVNSLDNDKIGEDSINKGKCRGKYSGQMTKVFPPQVKKMYPIFFSFFSFISVSGLLFYCCPPFG